MCIIFSYLSKIKCPNEFKLIIINNRDEFFHRPSKMADFITDKNIYAIDMTPGKEGGTWLGLSKLGRIGCLLNLNGLEYPADQNKKGRGNLVPNYLNFNEDAQEYLKQLSEHGKHYNPFNLIVYEKTEKSLWNGFLFNNHDLTTQKFDSGFLSLSNHLYDNPYVKTLKGQEKFQQIVQSHNDVNKKNELLNKLLELLKTENLENENATDGLKSAPLNYEELQTDVREKIYVNYLNYGTRTHTIILVDDKDKVSYHEYCLNFSDNGETKQEWLEKKHEFDLAS